MSVRLGFSVAAVLLEPDILFLDEVLAVGDIGFAMKCLNRVREIMAHSAVIFVSHSMPMVSTFCTRALVMERGRVLLDSTEMGVAIDRYMSGFSVDERVTGTGGAEVVEVRLFANGREVCDAHHTVDQGEEAHVELVVRVHEGEMAHVSVFVDDIAMSQVLAVPVKDASGELFLIGAGVHRLRVPLGKMEMNMGSYSLLVAMRSQRSSLSLCRSQGLRPFRIRASNMSWSKIVRDQVSELLPV
jgi:lipopolysaccharide transport system ATP-binding protein